MTILVFTPTIDDLMRPETEASIQAQVTDIHYAWVVSRYNPFPGEKTANVVAQYQHGREMCLAGEFDAMLTVEHDMVLPPDAIDKLYETDAPVVFGVYILRHGMKVLNTWQYQGNNNLGMSLSLYPAEVRQARARGWAQVSGVGWGCTLIRREVLERLPVRRGDGDAGDLAFATDCLHSGFRMIARFDVPCDHIEPDGNILRPYEHGGTVSRVLALQDVVAPTGSGTLPLKKGSYYTLPDDIADDLRRGGYVQITNADDSQEEVGEVDQPDITAREMAVDPKAATRGKRQVPARFLSVITRCYKRPRMLAENMASLARQSDPDYEQLFLVDEEGRGIGWSYRNMAAYAPHLAGLYILILDDDDMLVSESLIADLKAIAKAHNPDVIMMRMDHGARGVLPGKNWQRKPVMGDIGCSAFVVKRAIWQRHAQHFSDSYAGDFDFISSIFARDYEIYWFDCVASCVQRISLGEPE